MDNTIKLKRGLDLSLAGGADSDAPVRTPAINKVSVNPDDFPGFQPRMLVKEGDSVSAGSPLMCCKRHPEVVLCSPAAGTVTAIVRGERRKILRVEVTIGNSDDTIRHTIDSSSAQSIRTALLAGGLWAYMRQRPYDIVPSPEVTPRDIFITAFDSAPLAPNLMTVAGGNQAELDAALKALAMLTTGKVYLSTRRDFRLNVCDPAVHVTVDGPHPAGNPGIQAANIAPVNKGETIWTLDLVTLMRIGRLILTGTADYATTIALTGSEVITPCYIRTIDGAQIEPLVSGDIKDDHRHHRIISGNVLTGSNVGIDGFLRYPYRQITVIPEGDDVDEFMGWASMSPSKLTASRAFPLSALRRRFAPDARILGGRRAMIMSGVYDKVLPMDILPEYLLKAIKARDIDRMEQLGIYEVAPEDFALCEFVDPSKIEVQRIVREGLDYLRKELE